MHAQPSSGARCLIFGQTLRLLPYFKCANREGSGSPESSLLTYVTSTIMACAGSFVPSVINWKKPCVTEAVKQMRRVFEDNLGIIFAISS